MIAQAFVLLSYSKLETRVAKLNLLDLLFGYDKAVIIDAIQTAEGKAGLIYRLDPEDFDRTRHTLSSHGLNFTTTLALGKKLGLALPQQIIIFAIEVIRYQHLQRVVHTGS